MSDQNQIPLFSIPTAKVDPTDLLGVESVSANDPLPTPGSNSTVFASVILPLA